MFSKKLMGKEVGSAETYAKPHTPDGKPLRAEKMTDPNTLSSKNTMRTSGAPRVSTGDPGCDDVKTTGIKMRGAGAATKGTMSRGPMA